MTVKIQMEGDGFTFDRKIPMSVAVQIVQLVEEEDFEIEPQEQDDQSGHPKEEADGSVGETEPNEAPEDDSRKDMEGWR